MPSRTIRFPRINFSSWLKEFNVGVLINSAKRVHQPRSILSSFLSIISEQQSFYRYVRIPRRWFCDFNLSIARLSSVEHPWSVRGWPTENRIAGFATHSNLYSADANAEKKQVGSLARSEHTRSHNSQLPLATFPRPYAEIDVRVSSGS